MRPLLAALLQRLALLLVLVGAGALLALWLTTDPREVDQLIIEARGQ